MQVERASSVAGGGSFAHKVTIATALIVRYEQGGRSRTARLKLDAPWVGVASRC